MDDGDNPVRTESPGRGFIQAMHLLYVEYEAKAINEVETSAGHVFV